MRRRHYRGIASFLPLRFCRHFCLTRRQIIGDYPAILHLPFLQQLLLP